MKLCQPQPIDHMIKIIEDMLESAKSGEMRSFAGVITYSEKRVGHVFSINDNDGVMSLLGEIEVLKREFMDNHIQLTRVPAIEFCE